MQCNWNNMQHSAIHLETRIGPRSARRWGRGSGSISSWCSCPSPSAPSTSSWAEVSPRRFASNRRRRRPTGRPSPAAQTTTTTRALVAVPARPLLQTNQIKSNQIKSNPIKSNQIKSNQIKPIQSNQIKINPLPPCYSSRYLSNSI